ncbi:(2,3-dihydroxybenzoyl)adenylate synthase [Mycolicibacterium sp.]|uniref:(2,3-dihydroxybenzoyl)adenylate synthase n=1 Tax=Mycolicibacterium sp. TaxID=2320850 RepID=UPI003D0D70B4
MPVDSRLVPYPPDDVERYLASGAWDAAPVAQRFHEVAREFGSRTALIDQQGSISYTDLDLRSDQIAAAFIERGITPGAPILFQVGNSIPAVAAWYGVLKAGAIPVATLAGHRAHEIGSIAGIVGAVGHIVDDSRPDRFDMVEFGAQQARANRTLRHLFTVGSRRTHRDPAVAPIEGLGASLDPREARQRVEAVQRTLGPQDVAVHQLSGGTTGVPKVIPRLHGEYWNNARAWALALGRTEFSVTCHAAPIIHNAGISCALHSTHSVGGALVLAPPDRSIALRMMAEHRVDDTLFVHGMFSWIMSEEYEAAARHLQTVILSGAKVPDEVFARVERFGARVGQTFGMGEGMFALTPFDAPRELRKTTVGTPLTTGDEIRILDPGGERELPDGHTGELACRGWYTIRGYFDSPEHNATAFTADGFYRTGDLARVQRHDGKPFLSIEGRIKDLINRGGEKVNAGELELLLHQHPAIDDVAVVAMPDPRLGERVCAYLVTGEAALGIPALQAHLETLGVAKYKWPERVEIIDALPRTQVGKIDKKALRADIAAKLAPPVISA